MNEINSIEWHEQNLKNSYDYEKRLFEELKISIDSKIKYLNRISAGNSFKKFQLENAKLEKKIKFTDKYKEKSYKKKDVLTEKYSVKISFHFQDRCGANHYYYW